MPSPHAFVSRRALGVAVGVTAASVLYSSNSSLPLPIRSTLASRAASFPVMSQAQQQGAATKAPSSQATSGMDASPTEAPLPPPRTPVKAVNLRDISEVDPRLKNGTLFRCSQIYTPEVLKELKIKTVVDLRGRAERSSKKKRDPAEPSPSPSSAAGAAGTAGPPPLLDPQQVDALGASQAAQDKHHPQPRPGASTTPQGAATATAGSSGGGASAGEQGVDPDNPQLDFAVTKLRRQGSAGGGSVDEAGSSVGSLSEEEGSGNGSGVRRSGNTDEMAAALRQQHVKVVDVGITPPVAPAAADTQGGDDYWQRPETENFNVIPTREFGYAMLRMPLRVWRGAFGNLVRGKDPRKPFVDAFADEQLLGFFKYYRIILEHSKTNIAAVLRVFAKESSLPSLVHCAHGKDRTGVIIMLLLLICDTPHEAIVQDYVQSEVQLRQYRESLGLADPTGATGAVIPLNEVIIASTAETLRALLGYMDSTYITVDNYLASCGLNPQEVAAIRRNLMQPQFLTADGHVKQPAAAQEPAGAA